MSTAMTIQPLGPLPSAEDEEEMLRAFFGLQDHAVLKGGSLVATYGGQAGNGLFDSFASHMKKAYGHVRRHVGNFLLNHSDEIAGHASKALGQGADMLADRLQKIHPLGGVAAGYLKTEAERRLPGLAQEAAQQAGHKIRGYGVRPF